MDSFYKPFQWFHASKIPEGVKVANLNKIDISRIKTDVSWFPESGQVYDQMNLLKKIISADPDGVILKYKQDVECAPLWLAFYIKYWMIQFAVLKICSNISLIPIEFAHKELQSIVDMLRGTYFHDKGLIVTGKFTKIRNSPLPYMKKDRKSVV